MTGEHPYTPPEQPQRFLCAVCGFGESAHTETLQNYQPTGRRRPPEQTPTPNQEGR